MSKFKYDVVSNVIKPPVVSVAMLVYNHEKFLSQAIESILKQNFKNALEIVIADDCSTDNSRSILFNFAEKHPHVFKLILQHENVGPRQNNIDLLNNCSGRFIAALEGDDFWIDPNKIQKQVNFLIKNTDYQFCFTRFNTLNENTGAIVPDFNSKYFNDSEFIDFGFDTFQKGWHIGTQTLVFRNLDITDEITRKFKFFRDVHIIALLLKRGKGACLNFFGAVYRIHDGGIHTSVDEFNGFKIGYLTHKEIFLDNKSNAYLRRKYLHSYKNYLNANIRARHLIRAFCMSIDLFLKNWELINFLKHIKRIGVKLLNRK